MAKGIVINMRAPRSTLATIDTAAELLGLSRSQFMRDAATVHAIAILAGKEAAEAVAEQAGGSRG